MDKYCSLLVWSVTYKEKGFMELTRVFLVGKFDQTFELIFPFFVTSRAQCYKTFFVHKLRM